MNCLLSLDNAYKPERFQLQPCAQAHRFVNLAHCERKLMVLCLPLTAALNTDLYVNN